MTNYNLVVENPESTVVGCYEPLPRTGAGYQSEADLENAFIALLKEQAYEYLPIHSEEELIRNLRAQLEKLNKYEFYCNKILVRIHNSNTSLRRTAFGCW